MGMFDWVNFKCECPECGAEVSGFQTKDLECELQTVEPQLLDHFYSSCGRCGTWIDFYREELRGKTWLDDFRMEHRRR